MKTVNEKECDKMKDVEQILRRFLGLSEEKQERVLRGVKEIEQKTTVKSAL